MDEHERRECGINKLNRKDHDHADPHLPLRYVRILWPGISDVHHPACGHYHRLVPGLPFLWIEPRNIQGLSGVFCKCSEAKGDLSVGHRDGRIRVSEGIILNLDNRHSSFHAIFIDGSWISAPRWTSLRASGGVLFFLEVIQCLLSQR